MENTRYGMIKEAESDLIDEVTLRIKSEFGGIRFLEIGVCGAGTVHGMYRRAAKIQCPVHCAGVDWDHYKPNPTPAPDYQFFAGDSADMWRQIKDEFNFLFVDGCHCVNHAMMDFLNYSPFVVVGGYCLFHDTAPAPANREGRGQDAWVQYQFPQDHSYAGKHPGVLGVREGLFKLGLMQNYRADWQLVREVPSEDGLMGMCLFKKVKML